MHRATLAFADAGGLAIQLSHHSVYAHAYGDTVPVPPVGRRHIVGVRQIGAEQDVQVFENLKAVSEDAVGTTND